MAPEWISLILTIYVTINLCSGTALSIDGRLAKMTEILARVHAKNVAMHDALRELDTRIEAGKAVIQDISDTIIQVEQSRSNLKRRMDALKTRHNHKVMNSGRARSIKQNRQLHSSTVAFTAVISKVDLTNLNSGQPIVFDHIITNVGDAYNDTTGEFTAPISGLYVFNMDILVEAGENEYLKFVQDGRHVLYNFAHASGALHDESSSRLVVYELKTGNKIWIRTAPNAHHGSGNLHGNGFSTFSGWLLAVTE